MHAWIGAGGTVFFTGHAVSLLFSSPVFLSVALLQQLQCLIMFNYSVI